MLTRLLAASATAMLLLAQPATAQEMDCDAMFKKTESMVSTSKKMTVESKVKAYQMAAMAHEMCKEGKEDMASKLYFETEEYIRREQDRS